MSDVDEFGEFYLAHYRGVVTLAAAIVGNRADAEEIAQEAFARGLRRWPQLHDAYDAPDAWVRLVATRLAIDSQRGRLRRSRLLQRLSNRGGHKTDGPDEGLARTPIGAALMRLPPKQREVLVLRYVADLSVEAIAREHNIPLGTVKDRLATGRRLFGARTATGGGSARWTMKNCDKNSTPGWTR